MLETDCVCDGRAELDGVRVNVSLADCVGLGVSPCVGDDVTEGVKVELRLKDWLGVGEALGVGLMLEVEACEALDVNVAVSVRDEDMDCDPVAVIEEVRDWLGLDVGLGLHAWLADCVRDEVEEPLALIV